MTGRFNKRTEQISIDMATKVYQLKSNIIRNEFNGFMRGLGNSEAITNRIASKGSFNSLEPIFGTLLLSHPKMNNGWYAVVNKGDTIIKAIYKTGEVFTQKPVLDYQRSWIKSQISRKDTAIRSGVLINAADSLHWLVSSKHKLADSSVLIFGLDINLRQLQHYLWSVDTTGRAYAFIADKEGYFITNQEEKLIGTKMSEPVTPLTGKIVLGDSVSSYETVTSAYLQLPVIRYYTPFNIAGMNWVMVVDTPLLAVDEDVKVIEKYVLMLFISSALIILLLIAWAQTKWQKEFMLRQRSEMQRQEVSIEKQALSIITERQQKENALLQLNTLKEKVNPHFLFNSLSSLNALIAQNPELAQSFVLKLSKVYRYVLESYPNGLATVAEELNFVKEYFFLMKIRFGDALQPLEIEISESHLQERIPFMSLQTLIENAVKHNTISKTKPLNIKIESIGGHIVVTNSLQLRNDVKGSGKQGLNYLQSTYAYFGADKIRYGVEGNTYKCYLPLIHFTP